MLDQDGGLTLEGGIGGNYINCLERRWNVTKVGKQKLPKRRACWVNGWVP